MNTHPTVPGFTLLTVETSLPFSSISVDLITGLPNSHGFDSVMVVVDHGLSKGVIYCPCSKDIDATGVAQFFSPMSSLDLTYTPRSYQIVISSLPLHCLWHTTLKQMGKQNKSTNNWKPISGCSPQKNLKNGHSCCPWWSLLTTPQLIL